ncbi:hypothetical protein A1D31_37755 [Bradyrhizobium liaoningense]|nr:hypothetical protein A1D31_37755 [Bradyrhizobium liaoningense]
MVSPASTPDQEGVARCQDLLESLGFQVELGRHVFDRLGYLAGRDEDRLADLNDALNDPDVRAIVATRGGKGAYRIADKLDLGRFRDNPKLLIGFSETTILHLAIWHQAKTAGLHGACWDAARFGEISAKTFEQGIRSAEPITITSSLNDLTATLTTSGKARGILMGGNLDMIASAAGWILPSLEGTILLIEDVRKGLGQVDRNLTRLLNSGCLHGITGIAVGQFTDFEEAAGWSVIDVLRGRLAPLQVPILGGLPIGHGPNAMALAIGSQAVLDANAKILTVESAVA